MLNKQLLLYFSFGVFLCVAPVFFVYSATQKTETVNITVSGIIVSKPGCAISDSQTIEVNFGASIGINKIDGGSYRQSIPYTVTCEDNSDSLQLTLRLTGNAADFDADNATVRTTEQSDLGVKIYQNGKPFVLDESINININSIPTLDALLIKREGTSLSEGEFNAIATLRAEYQ